MTPQSRGGLARAKKLSPAERKKIAARAARARWGNPRKVLSNHAVIEAFCRKYELDELYVFGSILGPRFGPKSDVDLLYHSRGKPLTYFRACDATDELEALFGRRVDFINKDVIASGRNEVRCGHILATAKRIYGEEPS